MSKILRSSLLQLLFQSGFPFFPLYSSLFLSAAPTAPKLSSLLVFLPAYPFISYAPLSLHRRRSSQVRLPFPISVSSSSFESSPCPLLSLSSTLALSSPSQRKAGHAVGTSTEQVHRRDSKEVLPMLLRGGRISSGAIMGGLSARPRIRKHCQQKGGKGRKRL